MERTTHHRTNGRTMPTRRTQLLTAAAAVSAVGLLVAGNIGFARADAGAHAGDVYDPGAASAAQHVSRTAGTPSARSDGTADDAQRQTALTELEQLAGPELVTVRVADDVTTAETLWTTITAAQRQQVRAIEARHGVTIRVTTGARHDRAAVVAAIDKVVASEAWVDRLGISLVAGDDADGITVSTEGAGPDAATLRELEAFAGVPVTVEEHAGPVIWQ